jgi:hypothetical protein
MAQQEALTNKESPLPNCTWCHNPIEPQDLVYAHVADDMERDKAHHNICMKALKYFSIYLFSEEDHSPENVNKIVESINDMLGIVPAK